ncbi:hypothetical protein [Microbulbifer aggregans]|uniref:hypothetical protein n=1 Tax=Microbulbifer aggregans TaxID=1769779 RepID=UPI001CFD6CE5|nr:hypothetical protein [Microbulbifer aggregans]
MYRFSSLFLMACLFFSPVCLSQETRSEFLALYREAIEGGNTSRVVELLDTAIGSKDELVSGEAKVHTYLFYRTHKAVDKELALQYLRDISASDYCHFRQIAFFYLAEEETDGFSKNEFSPSALNGLKISASLGVRQAARVLMDYYFKSERYSDSYFWLMVYSKMVNKGTIGYEMAISLEEKLLNHLEANDLKEIRLSMDERLGEISQCVELSK